MALTHEGAVVALNSTADLFAQSSHPTFTREEVAEVLRQLARRIEWEAYLAELIGDIPPS